MGRIVHWAVTSIACVICLAPASGLAETHRRSEDLKRCSGTSTTDLSGERCDSIEMKSQDRFQHKRKPLFYQGSPKPQGSVNGGSTVPAR